MKQTKNGTRVWLRWAAMGLFGAITASGWAGETPEVTSPPIGQDKSQMNAPEKIKQIEEKLDEMISKQEKVKSNQLSEKLDELIVKQEKVRNETEALGKDLMKAEFHPEKISPEGKTRQERLLKMQAGLAEKFEALNKKLDWILKKAPPLKKGELSIQEHLREAQRYLELVKPFEAMRDQDQALKALKQLQKDARAG